MTTAIITGGSRGFGRAVAAALIEHGWTVVIDGRDATSLSEAAAELGAAAVPVVGDVADERHRRRLLEAAQDLGGPDLLVNNASSLGPSPLPHVRDVDADALTALHTTNVIAPLRLIQLSLPLLTVRDGAIINVTSDAAVEAYEGWGAYGSTKASLEQLSHVLAAEEEQVRVWWLDPGDMRTEMHQAAFPGEDITDRPLPESVAPAVLRLVQERPPSGRVQASTLLEAVTS